MYQFRKKLILKGLYIKGNKIKYSWFSVVMTGDERQYNLNFTNLHNKIHISIMNRKPM